MADDIADDIIFLTYKQMAEKLGITPASARRLAARHKGWPRQNGNDGMVRIGVPRDRVPDDVPKVAKPDIANDDTRDDTPDNASVVSALEAHIATLKEAVERAEALADKRGVELEAERARVQDLHIRLLEITAERERGLVSRIGRMLTAR